MQLKMYANTYHIIFQPIFLSKKKIIITNNMTETSSGGYSSQYDILNEEYPPCDLLFEHLVSSWWNCFDKVQVVYLCQGKYNTGEVDFEVKSLSSPPVLSFQFLIMVRDMSAGLPAPESMPTASCHASLLWCNLILLEQ